MSRSAQLKGRVSGAPREELEKIWNIEVWQSRTERTQHAVRHPGQAKRSPQKHREIQQLGDLLVLSHTFRLELFLGHQIYGWRHGHGWHAEPGRQCFHGACHHAKPRPSLTCPKPLAPRWRASKRLVIPTLQGQGGKWGRTVAPLSTIFHLFRAAAWGVTSSRRRSVPKANRLLNSLSRTCRAWKTSYTDTVSRTHSKAWSELNRMMTKCHWLLWKILANNFPLIDRSKLNVISNLCWSPYPKILLSELWVRAKEPLWSEKNWESLKQD